MRESHVFIDRALALLYANQFDFEKAKHQFAQSRDSDFGVYPLTSKEVQILQKTIIENSGDLIHLKRALPGRTPSEIVQGVYSWKLQRLKDRWEGKERMKITLRGAQAHTNPAQRESSPALSVLSLEDAQEPKAPTRIMCAFCSISASAIWYKSPIYTSGQGLCVYCGQYWRKYAAETANVYITEKKRQAALEHGSEEAGLGVIVPKVTQTVPKVMPAASLPSRPVETSKCVICRRLEPKRLLLSCAQCGLAGHQGCIGFEDADIEKNEWLCDLCENDRDPMSSILPFCVLCGETPSSRTLSTSIRTRKPYFNESDGKGDTALDVYKPTECNHWSHLLCALWIPEVLFANTTTMQPVEGAGALPAWRYDMRCSLCDQVKGACVKCAEPTCRTHFHVSCAYLAQPSCMMAFEIFPVKTSRRESVHTLTFKSESGHMCAQIWCKDHLAAAKSKKTYEYHEIDPKLKLTAMQAYVKTHKQVATGSHRNMALVESTHALLRRAKKLDIIQQVCGGAGGYVKNGNLVPMHREDHTLKEEMETDAPSDNTTLSSDDKSISCANCHTDWSPLWWSIPSTDNVCCTMCRPVVLENEAV